MSSKSIKLSIPLCWFNSHRPDRDAVKWDGANFVGHCRHCSQRIRRKREGGWRKDWLESD